MRRFLKFMLLWSIMLAVPVQGVAAATMALCGPIHQRMALTGPSDKHAHHGVHAGHDAHHQSSNVADASGYQASVKHANDLPTEKYSCSACATCCMSTVISGTVYQAPAVVTASSVLIPSTQTGFSGFIPETPEHPPRHILV